MATDVFEKVPPAGAADEPAVDRRRRRRRWPWVVVGLLLLATLAAGGIVGYGVATYAADYDGRILPTSVVAGVDVSGMTAEEALAAVQAVIAPDLERTVSVRWNEETWSTTPGDLGATSDVEEAVGEAVATSAHPRWVDYARMRWLDEELSFTRDVTVTHPEEGARAFVDAIATEVNLAPRDATLDYSTGWVEIVDGADGRNLDTDAGAAALYEAVTTGLDEVEVDAHPVAPAVTADSFDQVLLVRQHEHKVYLYQNGSITHSWNVAVGTGDHPTPVGRYRVTAKRNMPTWTNPSPTGWGASMPATIPPGVNNPLGVRAINWDAPAIRFHGTANVDSIGTDASKGCVRLTNDDVVQLYDLVREGATIISVRA
ncbi:MAG TPA: L,D-transpeptidase/peptidoglycan binding protein [Egibacteraceae bacterium]|nr:L,D-transpeptidase/peptidoglycan binding protein [Egibacteraceae bacterium]